MSFKSRNPFNRADRIAFPTMTKAMWECSSDASFGTPQSQGTPSTGGGGARYTLWTPASAEAQRLLTPASWLASTVDDGSPANYFADREQRGLVTPAHTPSDLMFRGSLYDPNDHSGSSCSGQPTPSSSSRASRGLGKGRSPGTGLTPQDVCRSSLRTSQQSPVEHCLFEPPAERFSGAHVRISLTPHVVEPTDEVDCNDIDDVAAFSDIPIAREVPRAVLKGPPNLQTDMVRESDSASACSISFGREDARLRSGDARDAGGQHMITNAQATNLRSRPQSVPLMCRRGKASTGASSSSLGAAQRRVARQLDFDGPEAAAAAQSQLPPSPIRTSLSESAATATCDFGVPSVDMRRQPLERDSHLSNSAAFEHDVASTTLAEFSPLRSVGTTLVEFSPLRSVASADQGAQVDNEFNVIPSTSSQLSMSCPKCGWNQSPENRHMASKSKVADGEQDLMAAMERIAIDNTPRGSVVMQLRLCPCGRGLCLDGPSKNLVERSVSCNADQPFSVASPSRRARGGGRAVGPHNHAARKAESRTGRSRSHDVDYRASVHRSFSAPHLARDGVSLGRARRSRSLHTDWNHAYLGWPRRNRGKVMGLSDLSLDEIQSTVKAFQARYRDRAYLQPWRCPHMHVGGAGFKQHLHRF